ncbi:two-partner secretion domain-containing protein, partial [Asaia astilbis]|uniref:two-partner secretion domain-containing protein n=1 Tax=Asaia astilbis TaxID=610244 RepID=UPI000565E638
MMTQYRTETDHDIDRAPSFARFYGAHAWPCSGAGAAERGQFAAGSGSIASTGTATTVTQSTARGVVNWQSFSIASGHSVQFENGSGATLNRVTGAQMSELQGHLGATGSLYLINPNGVVIGPNGPWPQAAALWPHARCERQRLHAGEKPYFVGDVLGPGEERGQDHQ